MVAVDVALVAFYKILVVVLIVRIVVVVVVEVVVLVVAVVEGDVPTFSKAQ